MMKFWVSRVFLVIFVCFLTTPSQSQSESVLSRQSDEVARTREERQAALDVLRDAAQRTRDADPTKAARFLNRAARLQVRLNSSQDALKIYEQALSLFDQSADPTAKIETLNGIAALYLQFSKCPQAIGYVDQALDLARDNKNVAGEAEALLTLSDCQYLDDQKLALLTAQKSFELWQSIGDKKGMARAYGLLSDLHLIQNNLAEATRNSEAALGIWQELNLPDEQAGMLINLGFIEYRKGAWQECISFLTRAQGLLDEDSEPFRMGQINAGIAEAFMEGGIPEAGLVKAKQAVEFYRRAEDPRGIVSAAWDVGKAYYLLKDYPAAIASLQQTARDAEAIGVRRIVAFCHDFLGRIYAATSESNRAMKEYQTALNLYIQLQNPRETARTRVLIGHIHARQGEVDKARHQFQIALDAFDRLSDPVNKSAALHARGKLELELNNLDLADDYLRRSIEVTENIRRLSTAADLMTAVSATVHDRYESYIDCLMRKHERNPEQGFAVQAFETSELARARALAELLRATQTNLVAGVDRDLSAQEISLRQSLHAKENARLNLLGTPHKQQELTALQGDLANLEARYKQVREKIRLQHPPYEQITEPTAMSLEQIQKQILGDDRNLLMEYSLGDERSYLWVVSRTEFSSYRLPGRGEIDKRAHRLHQLLSARPAITRASDDKELLTEIFELSRMLLEPATEKLQGKRLIIVADGAFQFIPFQALVSPRRSPNALTSPRAEDYRPLLADHEIINQPSASTLALLLQESTSRRRAAGSVAILADPVFEADDPRIRTRGGEQSQLQSTPSTLANAATLRDFEQSIGGGPVPRLLASREEAEAIMKTVPWRTGFKALDFEANRDTVSTPAFADHSIVHFATHTRLHNERPQLSGIVLSRFDSRGQPQNGDLRMSDIYGLKLPVDLVVLSACQTGLGKEVRGEGLIGLTRGFMYAGASGVTASLWKVDDDATAELMARFYEGMFQKGLTSAAAMREAQLWMWQQERWRAPYFWAAFIIQGRYDQVQNPGFSSPWAQRLVTSAGFVSVLLLMACFFVGRRRRAVV